MSTGFSESALGCYAWEVMKKNPHAVALGKKGGKKGGKARWEGVPPEERREIARRAALARWSKKEPKS